MPHTLATEIFKQRPFDDPAQEAYLNLVRTVTVLTADFERLFKEFGLSNAAYNALRILRGATVGPDAPGKRACHEIGDHLVARVPDVTRLVDRLERDGLAERVRDTYDRRVVFVRITPRGLDLLARLDQPVLELHRRQLAHLGNDNLQRLSELLMLARTPPTPANPPAHVPSTGELVA